MKFFLSCRAGIDWKTEMNVWSGMSAGFFFFGLFFLPRCMLASGVGLFFFFFICGGDTSL